MVLPILAAMAAKKGIAKIGKKLLGGVGKKILGKKLGGKIFGGGKRRSRGGLKIGKFVNKVIKARMQGMIMREKLKPLKYLR